MYRLFDAQGDLLYIGMSRNIKERVRGHELKQPWGYQITGATYEAYETRHAASIAERDAIRDEEPRFNVAGRPRLAFCPHCGESLP